MKSCSPTIIDMNECKQMTGNRCHTNADCFNVEASYLCQCKKDFVGDGFNCRRTSHPSPSEYHLV